jgi:hypothetical protein
MRESDKNGRTYFLPEKQVRPLFCSELKKKLVEPSLEGRIDTGNLTPYRARHLNPYPDFS